MASGKRNDPYGQFNFLVELEGIVVGGVVISMYLPLFSLIGKLSGH